MVAEAALRCRHHWLIAPPHGPTSRGVCKFCGAAAEFHNSAPIFVWEGGGMLMHKETAGDLHLLAVGTHLEEIAQ